MNEQKMGLKPALPLGFLFNLVGVAIPIFLEISF